MFARWQFLAGALLLTGCTVEIPTDVGGGGGDTGGGDGNGSSSDPAGGKLSSNGLVLDFTALELLDPAPLGHWASDTEAVADSGSLDPLIAHPRGAEHIEYLASCALDRGTELVAGGSRYPGLLGLATEWVEGSCGESCQNWLGACVLAHANEYGTSVTVSLRGAHQGLVSDDGIAAEFTVQEAAFYGNIFQITDGENPVDFVRPLFACSGRALMAWDEDPTHQSSPDYLRERICGTGDCGLNYMGPCVYPPVESESTCAGDAGWEGYYGTCKGEDFEDLLSPPVYLQVITTYLAE